MMMQHKLFKVAFALLIFVGVLNFVAVHLHLYWSISYFDSVVHFFAGMCVAVATVWLWFGRSISKPISSTVIFTGLVGAIGIGIMWEIFELHYGITSLSDGIHYITDTSSDLLMDTLGGLVGSLYSVRVLSEKN